MAIDNVAADRTTGSRRACRRVFLLTRMRDVNSAANETINRTLGAGPLGLVPFQTKPQCLNWQFMCDSTRTCANQFWTTFLLLIPRLLNLRRGLIHISFRVKHVNKFPGWSRCVDLEIVFSRWTRIYFSAHRVEPALLDFSSEKVELCWLVSFFFLQKVDVSRLHSMMFSTKSRWVPKLGVYFFDISSWADSIYFEAQNSRSAG